MTSLFSFERMNHRMDELHTEEENIEIEKNETRDLLKNSTTIEEKFMLINRLDTLDNRIVLIQKERLQFMDLMKLQLEKGAVGSPSKKMRRSLPPPTSGSKWTFDTLNAYSINFKEIDSVDELLFGKAPTTSDRAQRFTDACLTISHENILKAEFPMDHQAAWLAKHLYITISTCFGNMEASIDDMIFVLFNALGFNDEDLITVSQNRLKFQMSNKMVCADADLTVFNLKTLIRLALVEDKRSDATLSMDKSGEPQLIAEAVAAAMYNRNILNCTSVRRAISQPLDDNPTAYISTMMNSSPMSDIIMFMIHVSGSNIFFYSHKFSDGLLNSIANGMEPLDSSQIQKFTRMINGRKCYGFSLLIADDRRSIFRILDCIQQVISKM